MARTPSRKSPSPSAKAPQTLDQIIDHGLAAFRPGGPSYYAFMHATAPPVAFEVGQPVNAGSLENMVVARVLEGGKLLALCAGPVSDTPVDCRLWLATDVQPKVLERSTNFAQPAPQRIQYSQRDVRAILYMSRHFGCDMDPDYQRGLVWDEADQVKLIDSIFNNVDIGKFVFRELPYAPDGAGYEVIDGKQRMTALLDFTADKFAYKGVKWSELSQSDRRFLQTYPVAYAELGQDITAQQAMEVFLRLNTGGRPVSEDHLQKVREMLDARRPAPRRP